MSRLSPIVWALAAWVGGSSPALATPYTYGDTLTVIWKPLPNLPSFVLPGDTLTVWANAPASASGWSAVLRLASLAYPLGPAGGGWQPSLERWVLDFTVPHGLAEELYDLELSCASCELDVARHAVKVLPEFKRDFYFAQVTDTHVPEHAFSSNGYIDVADTSGMADFGAVIADLNLIRPEFVLHTGDLVNEGELEEYLGMYEMGRAQGMLTRLRDPIFISSGNHDIGGWQSTPPPGGTSRKNWWRYFGWPFLGDPPDGDLHHSQDYSFDYGLLHCIALEAYINGGSYDHYRQDIWGTRSFTIEQMGWLAADLAAVPPLHSKLLFYHYDFAGGQIDASALGVDGAIWGHNHRVPEGNRWAQPFDLGLQAVIGGLRTFRVFRVHDGVITPGPMHHSGGTRSAPVDSLRVDWDGPNDGSLARLGATVTNHFGETWDQARLVFYLADHDSDFAASGGAVAQVVRQDGIAAVYVDTSIPASGFATVSVAPSGPAGVGGPPRASTLSLQPPRPNPFHPGRGALVLRYSSVVAGHVRIAVYDLAGRRVARVFDGPVMAGLHTLSWSGFGDHGEILSPGVYVVRLRNESGEARSKLILTR